MISSPNSQLKQRPMRKRRPQRSELVDNPDPNSHPRFHSTRAAMPITIPITITIPIKIPTLRHQPPPPKPSKRLRQNLVTHPTHPGEQLAPTSRARAERGQDDRVPGVADEVGGRTDVAVRDEGGTSLLGHVFESRIRSPTKR